MPPALKIWLQMFALLAVLFALGYAILWMRQAAG